jgi:PAS domain S-box-containing protein
MPERDEEITETFAIVASAQAEMSPDELHALHQAIDEAHYVSMTDRFGRIVFVNDKFCKVNGFSREELIGQNHRIVNSGLHPREFFATMWQTLQDGRIWRGDVRNRSKEGCFYWTDTTIVPLLDHAGRARRYVSIRTDITKRKLIEEQLRDQASLTRLGEMASVVAHEVRNPLAGVSGALQILRDRVADDSEERMIFEDILTRLDILNNSLGDLLLFARPREVIKTQTNLRVLLEDLARATLNDPRFLGVEISVDAPESPWPIDHGLVRGALFNVALNAAFALRGRGHIWFQVRQDGGACRIDIRDDGTGMDARTLERVFEPFFTTKARGTGLGLPIVKRVMDQHGGQIRIDCPPEGGTVVSLVFTPE